MKKIIFILLLLPAILFSQNKKIDSLEQLLQHDKADTNKVKHLYELAICYQNANKNDSALSKAQAELRISQKLNSPKELGLSFYNVGYALRLQSDYVGALQNFQRALRQDSLSGNKKSIATCYTALGATYRMLGNYPESIKNHFIALKIKEDLGDKKGVASSYNNIGNIYNLQGNYEEALNNYFKALKINQETGNKEWMANNYHNIAGIYYNYGNVSAALSNSTEAETLFVHLNNKIGLAASYNLKGEVYNGQQKYTEALKYFGMSLDLRKENNSKYDIIGSYENLGLVYMNMKNYPTALKYLDDALQMANEIQNLESLQNTYEYLSQLDSAMHNTAAAYDHFKLYIAYRDSLFSEANTKKTTQAQMTFDFEKKSTEDSLKNAEQAKLKEVETKSKLKQEETKRYALYGGVFLLLVFGGFMFNRFRVTQKQKKIIEIKSAETEVQKNIIEEKQKEIVDSINYAKRIQFALLAHEKLLWAHLNEHFVLFQPKDIVSGDFYWATKKENRFYLACCDSTGHGVPGAFMSLLNISFLNEAIIEKNILEPNEILNHVRQRLIDNISKDGGQDGMDAILICIDKTTKKITYASAHNSPMLIHNNEIINLPADKMPVGKGENTNSFTLHTIDAQKGDTLFLYTDGFADQFGGPKGKKFKYKPFQEMLLANSNLPMKDQKNNLLNAFEQWRGNLEQVDDVLVIGMKI